MFCDDVFRFWLVQAKSSVFGLEAVFAIGEDVEKDVDIIGGPLYFWQDCSGKFLLNFIP